MSFVGDLEDLQLASCSDYRAELPVEGLLQAGGHVVTMGKFRQAREYAAHRTG